MKTKIIIGLLSFLQVHAFIASSEQVICLNRAVKRARGGVDFLFKKKSSHNYEDSYKKIRSDLMERVMQSDLSADDKLSLCNESQSHDNYLETMMPCIFIAGALTCGHYPMNCISYTMTQSLIESVLAKNIQSKEKQKKD